MYIHKAKPRADTLAVVGGSPGYKTSMISIASLQSKSQALLMAGLKCNSTVCKCSSY